MSNLASNAFTLGDVTSSENGFQGITTRTAKQFNILIFSLDGCVLSFSECPLVMVLLAIQQESLTKPRDAFRGPSKVTITIPYVRYRFLMCNSNFVLKTRRFSDVRLQKCRDLENLR